MDPHTNDNSFDVDRRTSNIMTSVPPSNSYFEASPWFFGNPEVRIIVLQYSWNPLRVKREAQRRQPRTENVTANVVFLFWIMVITETRNVGVNSTFNQHYFLLRISSHIWIGKLVEYIILSDSDNILYIPLLFCGMTLVCNWRVVIEWRTLLFIGFQNPDSRSSFYIRESTLFRFKD